MVPLSTPIFLSYRGHNSGYFQSWSAVQNLSLQDVNGKSKALWTSKPFSGIYKTEGETAAVLSKHILQNTDGKFLETL
jgi:hypothetical protein